MLAPDELTYVTRGEQLALYWAAEILVQPLDIGRGHPVGYFYLNAISFYLFGSEVPLKLVNALLGAIACRYAYLLARSLFNQAVARKTAFFAAYFPSLILWASVNIRDVWVIFLIVFTSWKSRQLISGYSHLVLAQLIGALAALTMFRQYLFFVVAVPPIIAILIGRRGRLERNFSLAFVATAAIVVMIQQGAAAQALETMDLETLALQRQGLTFGAGSAFERGVDISTPGKALAFLPVGMAYFFFSPFPWEITSFLKVLSLPEMLVIYALAPFIFKGLRFTVVHRFRDALQVLLLTGLLTVSYSLGSGNVGTLYRHRAQAVVFFLMFGAVGLELRASRLRGSESIGGQ